ncbi:MAG: anti-sigma factor domain-containing protein [Syntrophomonadaceae bacterium]
MARVKGMVLASAEGQAIILTPDGEYRTIKTNHPLEVGELYEDMSRPWWRYAVAAAVVLALTLGTLDYFRVATYAQVSGVVELGVNRWGRVISARALNDEGERLLQILDLKNMNIEYAVAVIEGTENDLISKIALETGDFSLGDAGDLTNPYSNQSRTHKDYPLIGAGTGDKAPEPPVLKIEETVNQGYYYKPEQVPNPIMDGQKNEPTIVNDNGYPSEVSNNTGSDDVNNGSSGAESGNTTDDSNDAGGGSGADTTINDGSDSDTNNSPDTSDNKHLDNRNGDRKTKSNNRKEK